MDVVFKNTRKKCMGELAGKLGGKSKALDVFTEWERGAVRFFFSKNRASRPSRPRRAITQALAFDFPDLGCGRPSLTIWEQGGR